MTLDKTVLFDRTLAEANGDTLLSRHVGLQFIRPRHAIQRVLQPRDAAIYPINTDHSNLGFINNPVDSMNEVIRVHVYPPPIRQKPIFQVAARHFPAVVIRAARQMSKKKKKRTNKNPRRLLKKHNGILTKRINSRYS